MVTIEAFVAEALYGPSGFYSSAGGNAGRRGDFITSPEVGPLFGAVIARALDAWWVDAGSPAELYVVEGGAGRGTLARSIRAADPACLDAVRYLAVEIGAEQRNEHPDWVESLDVFPDSLPDGAVGVVLANELLDNLPFGLSAGGSELHVEDDIPTTGVLPIQRQAAAWVERALGLFEPGRGRVLVFDYCTTSDDAESRPWTEWVRTYRAHERGDHPWSAPGSQDITCEVCIDQLPTGATVTSQADWLRGWGIDELVADGRRIWSERAHLGDLEALRARSRITEAEALLDETGLGGFTVLEWTT